MQTNQETESKANTHWRLSPNYHGEPMHEWLAANEFLSIDEQQIRRDRALRRLLEHCYDLVPYYKELFGQLNIKRRHLRDPNILQELPILEKSDVAANTDKLQAEFLAPGQHSTRSTRSSGTTGQPTTVYHDKRSLGMFPWLKQRELRWFRYDPMGSLLSIRPDIEMPKTPQGALVKAREILKLDGWPYMRNLFETGPSWGFSNINTVTDQAELLNRLRPNYLIMQSSCLEFISMQDISSGTMDSLRAVQSISNTLTSSMREQIESTLGVPVHQDYGLNEIGLVAARCPEGGRYHVHEEHCLVEIVNDDGSPCAPGSQGKLLTTSLSNFAMPLLRYDADDLAETVEGPCSCGRTLASFGSIHGRYRRTAFLPEGTFQRWAAIQTALARNSRINKAAVRKYQLYQDLCGAFELRIDCDPEFSTQIFADCRTSFDQAYSSNPTPMLSILIAKEFKGEGQRKFQNFISEFTPEID